MYYIRSTPMRVRACNPYANNINDFEHVDHTNNAMPGKRADITSLDSVII